MKKFKVHWLIKGLSEVMAENENDAIEKIKKMSNKELGLSAIKLIFDRITELNSTKKGGQMICPKCNKDIDSVWVISEYTQRGKLEGNKIVGYDNIKHGPVGNTIQILCPKCDEDILDYVDE